MNIISKRVKVNKTLINDEIELQLAKHGEPLRWAIVDTDDESFLIEAVFIQE